MIHQDHGVPLTFVVDIVSSYVPMNHVQPSSLPELIATVHETIARLSTADIAPLIEQSQEPAVSVGKSITPDFIICLGDGKKFRLLRRHLMSSYGMTPETYREKWKLPGDCPMVAPGNAAIRSQLAKAIGLGSSPKRAEAVLEPSEMEVVAAKSKGTRRAKASSTSDVAETPTVAPRTEGKVAKAAAERPEKTRVRPRKDCQPPQKAAQPRSRGCPPVARRNGRRKFAGAAGR